MLNRQLPDKFCILCWFFGMKRTKELTQCLQLQGPVDGCFKDIYLKKRAVLRKAFRIKWFFSAHQVEALLLTHFNCFA